MVPRRAINQPHYQQRRVDPAINIAGGTTMLPVALLLVSTVPNGQLSFRPSVPSFAPNFSCPGAVWFVCCLRHTEHLAMYTWLTTRRATAFAAGRRLRQLSVITSE
jgi:hypothetical protein